jgi:hypothetical protein
MHASQIFINFGGHIEIHVFLVLDPFADEAGRDLDHRGRDKFYFGVVCPLSRFISGAGINVKLVLFQDLFPVFPIMKSAEEVHSAYQYEMMIGIVFGQVSQRVDSIGRTGEFHFDVAYFETGMIFGSQPDKSNTVYIRQ